MVFGVGSVSGTPATVRKLSEPAYFEGIGGAYLEVGRLRIIKCINKTELNEDKAILEEIQEKLNETCTKSCSKSCQLLHSYILERIKRVNDLIEAASRLPKFSRQRRELLGKLLNYLLGVNDEAYRRLDDVEEDQEKLNINQHLLIHELKKSGDTQTNITQTMTHLTELVNDMEKANREDKSKEQIFILFQVEMAQTLTTILETKYIDILYPILDMDVWNRASRLHSNMEVAQKFAAEVGWNQNQVCSIMEHKMYNSERYELLRMYQVIQKVEETFKTVASDGEFLAVGRNSSFFVLNTDQWQACEKIEIGKFICHPSEIREANKSPSCAIELFKHWKGQSICKKIKVTLDHAIYQQLISPNNWLFAVKNRTKINVNCARENKTIYIQDSGIIQVSEDCNFTTEGRTMRSNSMINERVEATYNLDPRLHIITDEGSGAHGTHEPLAKPARILNVMETIKDELEVVHNHHNHYHYSDKTTVGTISIISCTVIISLIIIRYKKKNKEAERAPTSQSESLPDPATAPIPKPRHKPLFGSKRWTNSSY